MIIRRVGVWSVSRMYGTLCAAMGLIFGGLVASFSLIGAGLAGKSDVPALFSMMFGVGAVVFLPILYGVFGVIVGALGAVLYNLFAGLVGGIEIDVQ